MADWRAALARMAWVGSCVGCTALLDLDGYSVAADGGATEIRDLLPDAGSSGALGPGVAVFDHYRFERGDAAFDVAASDGLLANDGASAVVAGSFATKAGGGIEIAEDGAFRYTPPGEAGAFWGTDGVEYEVIGAPPARARVRLTVGAATFDLTQLRANGAGFGIAGAEPLDGVGTSYQGIDAAGDVNGDGFEDLVIGVPGRAADAGDGLIVYAGRGACVVFGKASTTPVSLAELDGESPQGFTVVSDGDELDFDSLGNNVAGVGDVNGDGFDDIIVSQMSFQGEEGSDPVGVLPGASYVVFGKADGAPVDPAAIRAGRGGGFVLVSPPERFLIGASASAAGDVNGDGFADVIVTTPYGIDAASAGVAYVVFGQVGTEPVELATLGPDGRGFEIRGELASEAFGTVASGVGDINGDGLDDVAVNASQYPNADVLRGRVGVVYGKRDTSPVLVADLADDPALGFVLYGADDRDNYLDARPGGDVNGDGFDDLLIGAPLASLGPPVVLDADAGAGDAGVAAGDAGLADPFPQFGVTYFLYGAPSHATMSLRDLEEPTALGFAVGGLASRDLLGVTVASGDVNGDGLSDALLGTEPGFFEGRAYAVLGAAATSTFSLPGDPTRVRELVAAASDSVGRVVASGADVNGDGLDELIVGAQLYPGTQQAAGGAYVAFGWDINDTLGARDRALIGTFADDTLDVPLEPIVIARGGNGIDTLRLGARRDPFDLRERGRYESIEVIDARGGGPQILLLDDAAVRRLPQNQPGFAFSVARRLTILGDAEDTLRFDMTGYVSRVGNAGRAVYGREGRYYGLEVSRELRIEAP